MSAPKTLTAGVLIWSFLATTASADATSSWGSGSGGSWIFFFQGRTTTLASPSANPLPAPPNPVSTPAPAPAPSAPISVPSQPIFAPIIPTNSSQPVSTTTSSFISIPTTGSPSAGGTANYDGFVNFGTSNFPEASTLAAGSPQAWYLSPVVEKLYGGVPSTQQQQQFEQTVLSRVEQTYSLAGMSPKLTIDPTASANHTISVVSGASYGPNPAAIGITDVGGSGFGFVDKLSYGTTVDQLEWAVAHNVSHELMHAFGVGVHPDQTGNYIDAATASWDLLTNPNTTFSSAAVSMIQATNFGVATSNVINGVGAQVVDGDQEIIAAPVPEPATLAVWTLVLGAGVLYQRKTRLTRAA
jgi:hypothetical protein